MKLREAGELGNRISDLLRTGRSATRAYALLAPVLAERTPFPILGRIGETVGAGPPETVNPFLGYIAAERTEGGWVVIGGALGRQLAHDPEAALICCRSFIIAADVWYAADILGERVPGPALVANFEPSLTLLAPWRGDPNRWVRRTVGVAVHHWAKRSQGAVEERVRAEALLAFLEPMFEEWDLDAVKGVGWGLKTLGRYYPDLTADWLARQVVRAGRPHRALTLQKALAYLSQEQRARATGEAR